MAGVSSMAGSNSGVAAQQAPVGQGEVGVGGLDHQDRGRARRAPAATWSRAAGRGSRRPRRPGGRSRRRGRPRPGGRTAAGRRRRCGPGPAWPRPASRSASRRRRCPAPCAPPRARARRRSARRGRRRAGAAAPRSRSSRWAGGGGGRRRRGRRSPPWRSPAHRCRPACRRAPGGSASPCAPRTGIQLPVAISLRSFSIALAPLAGRTPRRIWSSSMDSRTGP